MSNDNQKTYQFTFELRWGLREKILLILALLLPLWTLASLIGIAKSQAPVGYTNTAYGPQIISYQGRIDVNGAPFTGAGKFKFAIINTDGTAAFWSNDGAGLQTAPFEPDTAVTLTVDHGLFQVLLGDLSLANMTQPIDLKVFSETDRMLRVWFDDGANGFQLLSPDVQISAAPYSLNAEYARRSPNLQRIAQLRWYSALTADAHNITVGLTPVALAFDGMNMWVSNHNSHSVTVIRVHDRHIVRTVAVGNNPYGLAYDGGLMWITCATDNTVEVKRASDGSHIRTVTVGQSPFGIAYDGSRMWVTNRNSGTISVIDVVNGSVTNTIHVNPLPQHIIFDGQNMWVSHAGSNLLTVIQASTLTVIMTPTAGNVIGGLAFDGSKIWVTDFNNGAGSTIHALRRLDGAEVMTASVGVGPLGIAFDGENLWVSNFGDGSGDMVSIVSSFDGKLIAAAPVGAGASAVAFDGTSVWITSIYDHFVSKR